VTIAYQGKVAHNDSRGNAGVIGEGDVQWMTAGSGILHKEYHEKEYNRKGGLFQMVQLWVNLPARYKMTEPKYQAITNAEMGKLYLPNDAGTVEVIAGDFDGTHGVATTFSPVHLYNLKLNQGANLSFNLPENFTTAMVMIEGQAKINETETAPEDHFVLFKNDGEQVSVKAEEDCVILVMSGEPLNESISAYGPFLMNTREEIDQAIEDFQAGKFGYLED
jgi:redox-sensitive bicupin YhaK (pirin superfamily)